MHTKIRVEVQATCLRQLENVLLAVDDADGALGRPFTNVSGVQPT